MKENQHVEWKESWRDECLKSICGFANAEGGVLVVGRNDRGLAVGVKDARKLMEDVPNKTRDVLGIMVDVNLHEEAGKEYLEIPVEPYPNPVSYKGECFCMSKAWGRGIERMLEACRNAGIPEPELSHEHSGLWVKFHYPDNWASGTTQETTQETQDTTQETLKTTQEMILILLKANPSMTRRQLAGSVGLSENGVKYHLDRLKSGGLIRHVGSTKAGHWDILK